MVPPTSAIAIIVPKLKNMKILVLIAVGSLLGEISYNALESSYFILSSSTKYSHFNTVIQIFYLFFPKFYIFFPLYHFSKRIFFSLYFFYLSLDKTPFFLELNQKIPYFIYIILCLIPFLSMKYKKKEKAASVLEEIDPVYLLQGKNRDKQQVLVPQYYENIIFLLEKKLEEFALKSKIVGVLKGPLIDTFEVSLGEGIKLSKLLSLSDDLGLALSGQLIRIVYPMSGTNYVGIEVPKPFFDKIYLEDFLQKSFFESKQPLQFILGQTTQGNPVFKSLLEMPHLLVAGSTGSGKSVFLNVLLASLLLQTHQNFKLLLIDPKQIELASFGSIEHLLSPVLSKPKEILQALRWAIEEMELRYTLFQKHQVKNLQSFLDKSPESLPYVIIVIDEFADLMFSVEGKMIEDAVAILAAKARAAGIHIVLATQRPSVDVITGLIKANFPVRISFKVSSAVDSKVILDQSGAEKLLGKGDMLFKQGASIERIHGAYLSDEDLDLIIKKYKKEKTQYNDSLMEKLFHEESKSSLPQNDLFTQVLHLLKQEKTISTSFIQRRLKIGYNRAANMMEELEQKGFVDKAQGSKPRMILKKYEL